MVLETQVLNSALGFMYFFVCILVEGTIPTDYEQATGIEKKEIDAKVAGHEVFLIYKCYN